MRTTNVRERTHATILIERGDMSVCIHIYLNARILKNEGAFDLVLESQRTQGS